jgi:uncharacterized membrane protein YkvA (DUF1232 family)
VRSAFQKLKATAKRIEKDLVAVYIALRDERTPWYAKMLVWITIGYALSPVDLIPDFIPVLGYLDDLLLLPGLLIICVRLIPPAVLEDARRQAAEAALPEKRSWFVGVLIILIWITVSWIALRWILFS